MPSLGALLCIAGAWVAIDALGWPSRRSKLRSVVGLGSLLAGVVGLAWPPSKQQVAAAAPVPADQQAALPGQFEVIPQIGHLLEVSTIVFSPDCELIASGRNGTLVKVWDVRTGALRADLRRPGLTYADDLEWSDDGRLLMNLVHAERRRIRWGDTPDQYIWDVSTGAEWRGAVPKEFTETGAAQDRHDPGTDARELLTSLGLPGGRSIGFCPRGRLLAVGTVDGSIQIWDIDRRALVRTLAAKVPQWPTFWRKPLFSPDGRWLALTALPQVWNLAEGRLEPGDSAPQLLRRDERILAISQDDRPFAISPDGRFVAIAPKAPVRPLTGSGTNIVNILDVSSGEQRGALANLPGLVRAIGWSGDGRRIHVVTDSDLSVWDVSAGLKRTSQSIPGPNHWAAFSRDGETVARCDFGKIALMSLVDERWLQKGELHEAFSATDHALSPDGETLAIALDSGIQLWDVRSGKLRETLQITDSDDRAEAIAYHPNGSVLAVVGWNGLYLHRLLDRASLRLTILTGADGNPVWWVSDGKGRWSGPPEAARLRRAGDDLRYGDLLFARQLPELGWRPRLLPDFIQP